MSLILDSSHAIQTFPDEEEFDLLIDKIGRMVYDHVVTALAAATYSPRSKAGIKRRDSTNILRKEIIIDQKTNEIASFEFYADKFLAQNIPSDYQKTLKATLNAKTKKIAFKALFKIGAHLLETEEPLYGDLIKQAENITNLNKSIALKVATCSILNISLFNHPQRAYLLEDQYLDKWVDFHDIHKINLI